MPNKKEDNLREFALSITRSVGSVRSIVVHTFLFVGSFAVVWFGAVSFDRMLLVLTTVVSLEAIYLAIFIQMTINYQSQTIAEVEQDIDEIQEDIDEIQEDVDEIQEDVEEMGEDEKDEAAKEAADTQTLGKVHAGLEKLVKEVEQLQKLHKPQ